MVKKQMVRVGIFGTPGAVEWGLLSRQNHRMIAESEGILHYPWVYGLCLKHSTLRCCMHNKLGPHSTPILGDYRQNREGLGCTEAMMVVNNDLIANFHGLLWKHVIWVLEWMFQAFWIDWTLWKLLQSMTSSIQSVQCQPLCLVTSAKP